MSTASIRLRLAELTMKVASLPDPPPHPAAVEAELADGGTRLLAIYAATRPEKVRAKLHELEKRIRDNQAAGRSVYLNEPALFRLVLKAHDPGEFAKLPATPPRVDLDVLASARATTAPSSGRRQAELDHKQSASAKPQAAREAQAPLDGSTTSTATDTSCQAPGEVVTSQRSEDVHRPPSSRASPPERPAMARGGRAASTLGKFGGKCFIAKSSFDPRVSERRR
jgi:hypothetical protein